MIRKAKFLGLALALALMMTGMVTEAAKATPQITATSTPGEEHVHALFKAPEVVDSYTAAFMTRDCEASYEGTSLTGVETELTLDAEYASPGCFFQVGGAVPSGFVDVSMNSCDYELNPETKLEEDEYTGSIGIRCDTPGDAIEFKVTNKEQGKKVGCVTKYSEQTGADYLIFRNTSTDILVEVSVKNTEYMMEGGFFFCGRANGEYADGLYTSNFTLQAFDTEGNQIDAEVSGE